MPVIEFYSIEQNMKIINHFHYCSLEGLYSESIVGNKHRNEMERIFLTNNQLEFFLLYYY